MQDKMGNFDQAVSEEVKKVLKKRETEFSATKDKNEENKMVIKKLEYHKMCFKETITYLEKELKLTKSELQRVWTQNKELLSKISSKRFFKSEDRFYKTAGSAQLDGINIEKKADAFTKSYNIFGKKTNKVSIGNDISLHAFETPRECEDQNTDRQLTNERGSEFDFSRDDDINPCDDDDHRLDTGNREATESMSL